MILRLKALSLSAHNAITAVSGKVRINPLDNSAVVYLPDFTINRSWRDIPNDETCNIVHYELIGNVVLTLNTERRTLYTGHQHTNTFGSNKGETSNVI